MKSKEAKKIYIPAQEAARILRVAPFTIYRWCRTGRLSCTKRYIGKKLIRYVLVSSMKHAKEDTCEVCGKVFEREHYAGARTCSDKCRVEKRLSKTRKYPFVGRPPGTRKALARKWNESLKTNDRIKKYPHSYANLHKPPFIHS